MFCGNCGKEIGNNPECGFCGYNPSKDANGKTGDMSAQSVSVKPLEIVLQKRNNRMAVMGFIFGFFAWMPIPFWFLSFIFSTIGFFRAKQYRSGRVRAIFGWVFCVLVVVIYSIYIYSLIKYNQNA